MSERPRIALSQAVHDALAEADALPEIVVLIDPTPEILAAYALEERLGVIALVSSGPAERAAALEAGALEALDPATAEVELLARLQTAIVRFRSRLHLEAQRDELGQESGTFQRDLALAARLQRSFLPRSLPEVGAVRFASAYLPREFVSGDTYEVRPLGAGAAAFYTLDAVGHGVRGALLTVLLRSAFRPLDDDGRPRDPAAVLAELDRVLRDARLDESPTAAFCYGLLEGRRLRVANAGHPLPVRLRAGGQLAQIGDSGLLLGVQPDGYETAEVDLDTGDRVFFFTDGVGPDYGARFVEQLRLHRDLDLEDQVGGALGSVVELDAEGRPEDDVTILALEVTGD